MTDATSVFLEFKPVGNFHWIVNKASTFSFDQMTAGSINNRFKFIPCSACSDNWRSNINQDYTLNTSAITKCHYTDDGVEKDVDPQPVELIATEVQDSAGGFSIVCTGVTLQKVPDRVFDRTATSLVYTLLATTITEQ